MKNSTIAATLILLILTAPFFIFKPANAQDNPVKGGSLVWEKTFGGTADERVYYATSTDNGVLVVGSTRSIIDGQTVAWVLRLDGDGKILWNKTYPAGAGSEFRYIINQHDGFLLVGNTFPSGNEPNGYIVKIDAQGNALWNTTLTKGIINRLFGATKAEDGFVLAGLTQASENDNSDVWLIKITDNGQVMWNKTFGWSGEDAARSVATLDGKTFFVAGYTDSSDNGNFDFLLLKVDSNGNFLTNQTYGGIESDKAYCIDLAVDGFVIAGDTRSEGAGDSDALIIKIDQTGQQQWKHTYGGSGFDSPAYIKELAQESGFVVCGTTFSFGNGNREFWLLKLDNSGNQLVSCTVGRAGYEEAYAAVEVSQNNFVMAGWVSQSLQGQPYDFYVVKVSIENNTVEWWQTGTFIAAIFGGIFAVLVIGLLLFKKALIKKGK
jgi:hypothetical protein